MYLSFFRIIQANINAQARSAQAFKTTVKSKSLFCLQEKKGIGLIGCIGKMHCHWFWYQNSKLLKTQDSKVKTYVILHLQMFVLKMLVKMDLR